MSLFTLDLYLFWGLVMAFAGLGLGVTVGVIAAVVAGFF